MNVDICSYTELILFPEILGSALLLTYPQSTSCVGKRRGDEKGPKKGISWKQCGCSSVKSIAAKQ